MTATVEPIADEGVPETVGRLRATFGAGRARDLAWRGAQLGGIEAMVAERETEFAAALAADLGRPAGDAWLADLAPTAAEAAFARKHLVAADADIAVAATRFAWTTLMNSGRTCLAPDHVVGRVTREITTGATVVNHLVFHVLVPQRPFGGVGRSGLGAYHGRWGFEAFSHRRWVLTKPTRPDPSFIYPPCSARAEKLLRRFS